MKLSEKKLLSQFLTTYFSESDSENDSTILKSFIEKNSIDSRQIIIDEAKQFLSSTDSLVEDLGMEVNRWFESSDEASSWMQNIINTLESAQSNTSADFIVKDSNGTILLEGDSVQVIKDLKVKGGSSDLKRGTLIKNIHLIEDAENIEARVDGSTLVLKTMFLKKS